MIRRNSILFKVSVILALGLLLGQGGAGLFRFLVEKQKSEAFFHKELKRIMNRLDKSLEVPIWNLDMGQTHQVIMVELESPYVSAIILRSKEGDILKGQFKLAEHRFGDLEAGDVPPTFLSGADYTLRRAPIELKANFLATLEVYFTDSALRSDLQSLLADIVRDSVLLTVFLLLILYLSLRRSIVYPLIRLNESVIDFGRRYFPDIQGITSGDEIHNLDKNVKIMEDSIIRHEESTYHQVFTEHMTGLPNRNKLFEDLQQSVEPVLFLININSFKEIHEFYGNEAGDFVLIEMAKRLKGLQIPGESWLYKMPADEYVLLYDRDSFGEVAVICEAERILQEMEAFPVYFRDHAIYTSITIGIAVSPREGEPSLEKEDRGQLFIRSDMALKKAKSRQKPFLIYDDSLDMFRELESNIIWSKKLNEAVRAGRVILFFQPIVNNDGFRIEKYECLIRIREDDGVIHGPHFFLGVAKKTRLYPHLTRIVVQKAFQAFGHLPYEFSINISIDDILEDETREFVLTTLRRHPAAASRAVFEILESEGIENYHEVKDFIDEVKLFGCKIAIDDFGSGYSNFGHILKLDVNYLKIDASLIKNIHSDRHSRIVTKNIANFARELGIRTIAEYVGSQEVLDEILSLGIDYSQGYFFGEPKEAFHHEGIT